MSRTRTYSLLTIVFSFGLLMLGASVYLTRILNNFPVIAVLHKNGGVLLGALTLLLTLFIFRSGQNADLLNEDSPKIPLFQSFCALVIVGLLGILGTNSYFYTSATVLNTIHFFLGMTFISLLLHIDHKLNLISSGLKINYTESLKKKLTKTFHYSDALGLSFFVSFLGLTGVVYIFSQGGEILTLKTLCVFLFLTYMLVLSTAQKIARTLPVLRNLVFWGKVLIPLCFAVWYVMIEVESSPILRLVAVTLASLVTLFIWKLNLVIRSVEKLILKDERYSFWSDLLDLTKPRLGLLVMSTVVVGMFLAPRPLSFGKGFFGFSFTFLLVMGAAAFNCWMEIDVDKLMDRTKDRPLPMGRMKPQVALFFSSFLMIGAVLGLYYFVNFTTALLGAIAGILYVFAYTPLKQKSVLALYVGAIPGAIPPLMGWTIVMGKMTPMAWLLFAILFVWQLPHFLAISIYHAQDYGKADIKIYPNSFGLTLTKWGIFLLTVLLAYVSLYAWRYDMGVTDRFGIFAMLLNVIFVAVSFKVLLVSNKNENLLRRWARIYFFGSIIYLPLLLGSMIYLS